MCSGYLLLDFGGDKKNASAEMFYVYVLDCSCLASKLTLSF